MSRIKSDFQAAVPAGRGVCEPGSNPGPGIGSTWQQDNETQRSVEPNMAENESERARESGPSILPDFCAFADRFRRRSSHCGGLVLTVARVGGFLAPTFRKAPHVSGKQP